MDSGSDRRSSGKDLLCESLVRRGTLVGQIIENQLVRPPTGCMVCRTHSRFVAHSCSYLKNCSPEELWFRFPMRKGLAVWPPMDNPEVQSTEGPIQQNVRCFECQVSEKLLEKGPIGPKEDFEFSVGFLSGFQQFFSGIFREATRGKAPLTPVIP